MDFREKSRTIINRLIKPVSIRPFRSDKILVFKSWQLVVVAWIIFWAAAYLNTFWSDILTVLLVNFHIDLWRLGIPSIVLASILAVVVAAPFFEEWFKNYLYRRLHPYQGLLVAVLLTIFEALEYWAFTSHFGALSWSQLVARLVLPNHVIYFLVSWRFKFGKLGQGLATLFHGINNLIAVILTTDLVFLVSNLGEYIDLNLLSVVSALVAIFIAWPALERLNELSDWHPIIE